MSSANVVELAAQVGLVERRAHQRIKAVLPAELRPEGSETAVQAQTSDISLGGCYIPMIFTLEVGRMVDIALMVKGHKVGIRGVVVSRHPQRGNGIMFLEMEREDRIRLQNCLRSLLDLKVERPH